MHAIRMLLVGLVLASSSATAQSVGRHAPIFSAEDRQVMDSPGFLSGHPDHRLFRYGMEAWHQQRYEEALRHLRHAARYANKSAQAMIAEAYWKGIGVPVDRSLAYAWMDLAAERLYARYLGHRERYWEQLSEAERLRAQEHGRVLYAEFGDDAAKPRLEQVMQRERRRTTGSRVGADMGTRAYSGGPPATTGSGRYGPEVGGYGDRRFWEPQQYWAWQDAAYRSLRRESRVMVSEITIRFDKKKR